MELTQSQVDQIVSQGWCLISAAEARTLSLAKAALRRVNLWCADAMLPAQYAGITRLCLRDFATDSFCADIRRDPAFLALVEGSGVRAIVNDLVGPTDDLLPQIALRFPDPAPARGQIEGHIDGFRAGRPPDTFTLLAGFFLADVAETAAGNFCVWPGSHELAAEMLRNRAARARFAEGDGAALNRAFDELAVGEPLQVLAEAGDVILCHSLLLHGTAWNEGAQVRPMMFVRFRSLGQARGEVSDLGEPWKYWTQAFRRRAFVAGDAAR